jgi:hypothetical protein
MDRSDEQNNQRTGDVLGLGDVVSDESRPRHTSMDPEEERKRRARMQEGADDLTPASSDMPRRSGATGIDMGAGGEGTDVE